MKRTFCKIEAVGLLFFLAMLSLSEPLSAQSSPSRDRDRDRPGAGERDGRDRGQESPGREREPPEGTEEGMPELRTLPGQPRVAPHVVPAGWRLGVYAANTQTGVRVTRVIPNTAAARAGLEQGDRIVAVDGYQIGFVNGRLYSLGEELQRRAGPDGRVSLLVQNRRNLELLVLPARLDRFRDVPVPVLPGAPRPQPR